MLMIGCDFHTRFQQIAMVDLTTGEVIKRRLEHHTGAARHFYAALPSAAAGHRADLPAQEKSRAPANARWAEAAPVQTGWIVERTIGWLGNFRRLVVRYDRSLTIYRAFFQIAFP